MASNQPPTPGELAFLQFQINSDPWNGVRGELDPDCLVHSPLAEILCEIKDFAEGEMDKEIFAKADMGQAHAGECSSWRTRQKIWESFNQLNESNGRYPSVTVLFNQGYFPQEEDICMKDALYGKLELRMWKTAQGLIGPGWSARDHEAKEGKKDPYGLFDSPKHTHVSAVAVLEELLKNKEEIEKQFEPLHAAVPPSSGRWPDRKHMVELLEKLEQKEEELCNQHGDDFITARILRMRIYHNHNAALPLPQGAFGGAEDIELFYDP